MNDTDPLIALIERRTGMEISTLGGVHTVQLAAARSMETSGISDPGEWRAALAGSSAVWQTFLHHIVVPETFFFRYPESFDALSSWVSRCPSRPIRVLSLPCSTGEEVYSIAVTLARKASLGPTDFVVDGIDVSANSVGFARRGAYPLSSFRGGTPPARWFEEADGAYKISNSIRSQVHFETGNFWEITPPGSLYDIVFCRNLLIYFSTERQKAALEKLESLLHPDGALFLGPAEMPLASKRGWKAMAFPMAFACTRPVARTPMLAPAIRPASLKSARPAAPASPTRSTPVPAAPATKAANRPAPSPAPVPTLETIRRLADGGAIADARAALALYLQTAPPDADSFSLGGLLAEAEGNRALAESQFRKALYLSPDHPEAISHLAWLLNADGRLEASRKLLARAQRLHER